MRTVIDYTEPGAGFFLTKAEGAAASAAAQLEAGNVVSIQVVQNSGEALNFAGGSLSIAWLGN